MTSAQSERPVTAGGAVPLVTIITPTYNRAAYLEETIESVLSQGYPALEYIVIDDGSTDDTQALLGKYAGRIRSFHHPNQGEVKTINRGLGMATGEIVGIVSSDDPLLPGAISKSVAALLQHPEAVVVYSDWRVIGPASETVQDIALPDYSIKNMLEVFQTAITSGAFFKRRLLETVGLRDPSLRYAHDLDFWLRAALRGEFVHLREVLTTHREHPGCQYHAVQGKRYADEIVRCAAKLFEHGGLPVEVARLRATALGNAHGLAASYCGSSRWARARHHLLAFRYQPVKRSGRFLRYLRQVPGRVFWGAASFIFPRLPGGLKKLTRALYHGVRRAGSGPAEPSSSQRAPGDR